MMENCVELPAAPCPKHFIVKSDVQA